MAFDAPFTAAILREIADAAVGARIEKIFQPAKESILLILRNGEEGRAATLRLLIDAGTANPRMGFLTANPENPKVPPMLCMLLRKHLNGGRITAVRQLGFERAAEIEIEARDELGFPGKKYLIAEIMGKFSNLIFCDGDRRILAAVHTQDLTSSNRRPILPGLLYSPPPAQAGKRSPLEETDEGLDAVLTEGSASGLPTAKLLVARYAGLSPLIAREIAFRAGAEFPTEDRRPAIRAAFREITDRIREARFIPYLLRLPDGTPLEYAFLPIGQYGDAAVCEPTGSFSELIELFFSERSRRERLRQRATDLLKLLSAAEARLTKKIALQEADLAACADKEKDRRAGDLLTAHLWELKKGMTEATVVDYAEEDCPAVTVALDARLTPAQNAQRYYKKYNKQKSAESHLTEQLARGRAELAYLATVSDALDRAEAEADLNEIRRELFESGYASRMKGYTGGKLPAPKPLTFVTSGGWTLLCGKNNSQNDFITHRLAGKGDLWFHVKGMPGSHVVLLCDGAEPDAIDFTEAATVAATYSKAPAGQRVEVDYTRVKNLKKPPASKPGYVTFSTNYSALVTPDKALCERLLKK